LWSGGIPGGNSPIKQKKGVRVEHPPQGSPLTNLHHVDIASAKTQGGGFKMSGADGYQENKWDGTYSV